jgi:hypothetical protein
MKPWLARGCIQHTLRFTASDFRIGGKHYGIKVAL